MREPAEAGVTRQRRIWLREHAVGRQQCRESSKLDRAIREPTPRRSSERGHVFAQFGIAWFSRREPAVGEPKAQEGGRRA
jgi:hypothetical protein